MSRDLRRRHVFIAVLSVLSVTPLVWGAWSGFPVQDDSYLMLILRDAGVTGVLSEHPDRPVLGILLSLMARLPGGKGLWLATALTLRITVALETALLWRRLFPSFGDLWPLPAVLTLAPILVKNQYTTITSALAEHLPISLGLAGLLFLLAAARVQKGKDLVALGLFMLAATISEYGLVIGLCAAVVLACARRYREAGMVLAAVMVGYGLFFLMAKAPVQHEVRPAVLLQRLYGQPLWFPSRLLSALFFAIAGAYGDALGTVRVDSSSKSTLLALGVGVLIALAADRAQIGRHNNDVQRPQLRQILALLAGTAMGLAPVVLAIPWPSIRTWESRFAVAAMPFAVMATVAIVAELVKPPRGRFGLAILAFLVGYRLTIGAFDVARSRGELGQLGALLHPLMDRAAGMIVAVVDGFPDVNRNEILAKATLDWDPADARRLWIERPGPGVVRIGDRLSCEEGKAVILRPELRMPAVGPVSRVIWVRFESGQPVGIEPYCLCGAPCIDGRSGS